MRLAGALGLALAGCGSGAPIGNAASVSRFDAPVMINPESPVSYPEDLFAQRVEGTVLLRLFVDARGTVLPESTRLAESSGFPALDSAAMAGVSQMRFAPARRDGEPVAAAFLQPVQFRHPERSRPGGP
ncbi:MAG: energy transducer TonB [Gemmatimonadetes bacterium]|nr:energy transducer TonB [Gemmatimonadota bacterium]